MDFLMNRRELFISTLTGIGSVLIGSRYSDSGTVNDSEVKAVNLNITCTTEILNPPKDKDIRIWIPVPPDDHEQEISGLTVISRIPYKMTKEDIWGNRMFFFNADNLTAKDKIVVKYRIRRKAGGISKDLNEKPERHLEPSEWEKWDDNITEYVDALVGSEKNPVKIGKKIYDAIVDSLTYVHEVCGRGVSQITLEEKTGRCDEFHALFRSMMMYKGIPVRWEQGIALLYPSVIKEKGEFEADCINAHSWVRFYIGGNKWMPADLSEAKRRPDLRDFYFGNLPPNRIKMSTGRGLTLNPMQEGIINTFPYTYIEADGVPLIYGHNYRNIMRYELIKMEM
ncbi:MAG: transglutaminase domain-containing protein [Nitrospirota bacterium]